MLTPLSCCVNTKTGDSTYACDETRICTHEAILTLVWRDVAQKIAELGSGKRFMTVFVSRMFALLRMTQIEDSIGYIACKFIFPLDLIRRAELFCDDVVSHWQALPDHLCLTCTTYRRCGWLRRWGLGPQLLRRKFPSPILHVWSKTCLIIYFSSELQLWPIMLDTTCIPEVRTRPIHHQWFSRVNIHDARIKLHLFRPCCLLQTVWLICLDHCCRPSGCPRLASSTTATAAARTPTVITASSKIPRFIHGNGGVLPGPSHCYRTSHSYIWACIILHWKEPIPRVNWVTEPRELCQKGERCQPIVCTSDFHKGKRNLECGVLDKK